MSIEFFVLTLIALPVLLVCAILGLVLLRWMRRDHQSREERARETQELQEMHRLCERLDKRLDALETIILGQPEGGSQAHQSSSKHD